MPPRTLQQLLITRGDSARVDRRSGFQLCVPYILALVCGGIVSIASAQPNDNTNQDSVMPTVTPVELAISQLADATASDRVRANAAVTLLTNTEDPAALESLRASLAAPLFGVGGGRYVLQAISDDSLLEIVTTGQTPDTTWPPAALLDVLATRVRSAEREELPVIFAALARFKSRFAAEILLDKTVGDVDEQTANGAFAALRQLSGREDLPDDTGTWRAWLAAMNNVSESHWQRTLADNFARLSRSRAAESTRYADLLVTAQRKLYLSTPAEERPAMLIDLLGQQSTPALRDLAFDLCQRELSNTGTLDERIGGVALLLLTDPSPAVRSRAAILVRQLTPRGSAGAIVTALNNETDPQAASDLLLAAARTPTPDAVTAVMKWVLRDSDARPAAIEAVLRITRVIDLSDSDRESLLTLLRSSLAATIAMEDPTSAQVNLISNGSQQPSTTAQSSQTISIETNVASTPTLSPAGIQLLATLGDDSDRDLLVTLVADKFSPVVRTAAVEALLWYPQYTQTIVHSARSHPELVPGAIKAVTVQSPTAAQLSELLTLAPVSPEAVRPDIAALVRVMNADEVLPAVSAVTDPALRSLLITSLSSPSRYLAESARPEALAAICRGVLMLAEDALARGDAALTLSTLDSSPHAEVNPATSQSSLALRLSALLALGREQEVTRLVLDYPELQRNITSWMRGAELAATTSAGPRIATYIDLTVGAALSPQQRLLLQSTAARDYLVGPPAPTSSPSSPASPSIMIQSPTNGGSPTPDATSPGNETIRESAPVTPGQPRV